MCHLRPTHLDRVVLVFHSSEWNCGRTADRLTELNILINQAELAAFSIPGWNMTSMGHAAAGDYSYIYSYEKVVVFNNGRRDPDRGSAGCSDCFWSLTFRYPRVSG